MSLFPPILTIRIFGSKNGSSLTSRSRKRIASWREVIRRALEGKVPLGARVGKQLGHDGSGGGDTQISDQDEHPDRNHTEEISTAIVRQQLEEVLSSPMFDASERNRRFLRYIVEETLASRGIRIKGYSVGVSVFSREANFDPQIDPVVRIEAGRLRRSLERYYLTDGRNAIVRISVPKGGYVPKFSLIEPAKPRGRLPYPAPPPARGRPLPVYVQPFVSLTGDETVRRFAAGLNEELIVEFGKHREFEIFAPPEVSDGAEPPHPQALEKTAVRFIFSGSVRPFAGKLRIIAHFVDRAESRHLWSGSFDRDLTKPAHKDPEKDLGHKIVAALIPHLADIDLSSLS